jgi:polar amino acid transport system substrate-binding protein
MKQSRFVSALAMLVASIALAGCSSAAATQAPTQAPATNAPTLTAVPATAAPTPTAGPPLRIGLSPDNPPMEFADANDPTKYTGFDIDMIQAVMQHENRPYTIQAFQFSGLIPALQAGQIDLIISDLWVNADRSTVVDFVSYQVAAQSLLVKTGNPLNLKAPLDLCGHRAAAKLGTVGQQWLQDQSKACTTAGKAAVDVSTYPDLPTGLLALDNGRTDAIFEDALSTGNVQRQQPGKYAVGFTTPGNIIVAAAVKKGNSDLANVLNEGMSWYQSSGGYAAALTKWSIPAELKYPVRVITNYVAPTPAPSS